MNGSIVSISMLIELFGWISIPWEIFDGGSGSSRSLPCDIDDDDDDADIV
jgi:hypothetical protein